MDYFEKILTPILKLAEAYVSYPLVIIVQSANQVSVVSKYLAKGKPPAARVGVNAFLRLASSPTRGQCWRAGR